MLIVVMVAALAIGFFSARLWRIEKTSLFIVTVLTIAHFIIAGNFFIFGSFSLNPALFGLICISEALLVAFFGVRTLKKRGGPLSPLPREKRKFVFSDFLMLVPLACVLVALAMIGLKIGPRYSDAVEYHLVSPVRWLQEQKLAWGGMGYHDWAPLMRSHGFPNTSGIFAWLFMAFTKSLNPGALKQASFALTGLVAVYALARELGIGRKSSIGALYFCVFIPEFMLQFSEAYADLAMAGCIVTCALFLYEFMKTREMKWWVLFCLMTGLAGGVKNTGIIFSGALFLIALGFFIRNRVSLRSILKYTSLLAATWLFIAGPWYIHNTIRYKNPLYPMKVEVAGHTFFDGPFHVNEITQSFMERRTDSYAEAIWITYRDDTGGISLAQMFGGLGSAFFILGIPALFISLLRAIMKKDRRFITLWLIFFVIYLFQPVKWHARFTLYFAFFAGICIAWLMHYSRKPERIAMGVVLGACLVFNGVKSATGITSHYIPPDFLYYSIKSGDYSPERYRTYPSNYPARQFVTEYFRGKDAVIYYFPHTPPISLMPEDMQVRLITFPSDEREKWIDHLLQNGVEYIHTYRPRGFNVFNPEIEFIGTHPELFETVYESLNPGLFRGRTYSDHVSEEGLYRIRRENLEQYSVSLREQEAPE